MEIESSLLQRPTKKPFRLTKKPGSSFNVSLDLTKRRYNLLTKTKGLITNNPSVAYAFSDVNCSLVLKFNDSTYCYFNSKSEL